MNKKITPQAKLSKVFKKYCEKQNINEDDVEFYSDSINEWYHTKRCRYKDKEFSIVYEKSTQACYVEERA